MTYMEIPSDDQVVAALEKLAGHASASKLCNQLVADGHPRRESQLAIQRARAKAERALGPKFDIRAFHDTVLALGSVPLPVLEARIDRFIAEGGPSPYAE